MAGPRRWTDRWGDRVTSFIAWQFTTALLFILIVIAWAIYQNQVAMYAEMVAHNKVTESWFKGKYIP